MTLSGQGLARDRAAGVPDELCPSLKSAAVGLKLFLHMKWAVLMALLAAAAAASAQTADQPQQRMSETVSVGYVMIPFTPLDEKGRAIIDLRADEVSLRVDDQTVRSD